MSEEGESEMDSISEGALEFVPEEQEEEIYDE
jgi:hypothetical protein